jgi:hypothetical protein
MMRLRLIVFACIVLLGITTTRAQQGDQILQFEISKDGVLIARPLLLLRSGMVGRIHLDGRDAPLAPNASGLRERIELTPTVQGDNISIAFDIASDAKRFQPSLVISSDVKGGFEWVSFEGHAIRLSVSWIH